MATWSEFAAAAPALAERVKERFDAHKHKTMATIRKDGGPRISGTECQFQDGELFIGSMWKAVKALDLQRDGRFAIHSATVDPEALTLGRDLVAWYREEVELAERAKSLLGSNDVAARKGSAGNAWKGGEETHRRKCDEINRRVRRTRRAIRPPRLFPCSRLTHSRLARGQSWSSSAHPARACKRCGSHPSAGPAHGSERRSRASSPYSRCPYHARNSGPGRSERCAQPQARPDR